MQRLEMASAQFCSGKDLVRVSALCVESRLMLREFRASIWRNKLKWEKVK
jgi:hypothetical protein